MYTLPHFDAELALERASGDEDLVQKLNLLMKKDLEVQIPKIAESYQNQKWDTLLNQIHRLHGACCYTGVAPLQQQLHTLLNALTEKNVPAILEMEDAVMHSLTETAKSIPAQKQYA